MRIPIRKCCDTCRYCLNGNLNCRDCLLAIGPQDAIFRIRKGLSGSCAEWENT